MSNLRVLVVGASIAGPTAAYWLARAGASVTVIERFPNLRTNGQNVDIRTIGVAVMRRMAGMEAAVRSKIVPIAAMALVRSDGRPYGTIKPTGNPDQQSLVSEFEIYRGDLARILYDMTKDHKNIRYVFGEQIAAIRHAEKNGPVTVDFANGHPSTEYDLVVGADGATSRTRALAFGGTVREHMRPINAWAAFFTIARDLVGNSGVGHGYTAVGGRFIAIGADPAGGNRVTLMGIYPPSAASAMDDFREAAAKGEEATKKFIADRFVGAGWKTDEIMDAMLDPTSTEFYANEIVQVKTPALYSGRIALIGDAGYASGPTGMGTSAALAGAYILAGEMAAHPGDIEAGLRAYEERMRPVVTKVQKIPSLIPAVLAPYTAWGLWLRNNIFALICWTRVVGFAERNFAWAFASSGDEDSGLPVYDFEKA
ncbi:oxidoreductase [Echria macrotheca]|uniref:Oxidoreductase n=1 Tax=Echria macrotheca TaxID=438768 RepID=A0AAJ0BIN3_9PEZI|nr:oxidoreductase [Echria macrotheca]